MLWDAIEKPSTRSRDGDGGRVVLRELNREEIDPDIQEQRIVEFYSR
jgi:hypothetical protein